jgi:hypothetical protein
VENFTPVGFVEKGTLLSTHQRIKYLVIKTEERLFINISTPPTLTTTVLMNNLLYSKERL